MAAIERAHQLARLHPILVLSSGCCLALLVLYCCQNGNAQQTGEITSEPRVKMVSLADAEQASVLLDDFGRDVLRAKCKYIGALGANNVKRRKMLACGAKFSFSGVPAVWGNTFWTCQLNASGTGNAHETRLELPGGRAVWVHWQAAAVDYNDTDLNHVQSLDGRKLVTLLEGIS